MRVLPLVSIALLLTAGLALASCANSRSLGGAIGDALPTWAGGLPKDTPPRPGSPGYEEFRRQTAGQPAAQEPEGRDDTEAGESSPAAPSADRR